MTTSTTPAPRTATPGRKQDPAPLRRPRVVLADRGDALVSTLSVSMRERFDVVEQLDTELSRAERLVVAAATVRTSRHAWAERFYKSNVGVALRSRRARAGLKATTQDADVVFQTHALFETSDSRTVLYIDCTHRQSMRQWPDWNPLRGKVLEQWLRRELRQYQQAAHVFAFCEETAQSLIEEYAVPPERVSVVGAGVNFERLPEPRQTRTGPPTVLFVGNDFERKGGVQLLAAFAELRRRVPEARLRIVGADHSAPAQDGVEHLGRVHGREAMSALYAEADVFCLPSLFDPFPGALLEAMAHELPCVVTDTCGIPEMVVEDVTALVVERDQGDQAMVADLAAAFERLVREPGAAAEMGRLGRQRVERHFLWSHVVDRMAPAIELVAGLDPHRP